MGASTAMTIAAMAAVNNTNHQHHHSDDEGTMLLALVLTLVVISVLWIAVTSIKQLIVKDEDYDFFDDNLFSIITLGVMVAFAVFYLLFSIIYTLIK